MNVLMAPWRQRAKLDRVGYANHFCVRIYRLKSIQLGRVLSLAPLIHTRQSTYPAPLTARNAANTRQARSEMREAIFHRNTCLARYRARDGAR